MSELQFSPRPAKKEFDESLAFSSKFDSDSLIAAMAVDQEAREPLTLACMNTETLKMTIEKGKDVYYLRSRQEIGTRKPPPATLKKFTESAPTAIRTP